MADFMTPTVIQQRIPEKDISPLERLLLSNMFDYRLFDKEVYLSSEDGPATFLAIDRSDLEGALAKSRKLKSLIAPEIERQLAKTPADVDEIDIDLSSISWETLLQDIVKRSSTLRYLTVVSSFTCTKMRPDGFGGMAILITKDAIKGKSTNDILEDFLAEAGFDQDDARGCEGSDDRRPS
jgi:hypothetical protein